MQKQSLVLKGSLRLKIQTLFNQHSSKILFIHPELLQLLNFAYDFKLNNLIPNNNIVLFENDTEAIDDFAINTLIFILNPITTAIKTLNSIILRNQSRAIAKKYVVYFVPKIDIFCQDELNKASLAKKIEIHNFNFGLISFNPGLISLQLNQKTHPVDVVNLSVQSLMKLSKIGGKFNRIIGKGEKSKIILENYQKLIKDDDSIEQGENDHLLIVIDRKIDLITPLLSGHSYEALLDHFFEINHNKIMVPSSLLGGIQQHPQEYLLHNQRDPVYEQIAYLSIEEARDQIQKKSVEIKERLQFKRYNVSTQQDTIQVNKIRAQFEQVQNHTQIILQIMNRMNELHYYNLINIQTKIINDQKADLEQFHFLTLEYKAQEILRLISLYSQVYLNANFYSRFQKQILQIMVNNYSPVHIHSLYLLQKAGILKNNKMRNKWQQMKHQLNLIPDEPASYTGVHITYSSLSVRYIELILKQQLTPQLSVLLGKQNYSKGMQKWREVKELYVFYVGGITYGQISCLRMLEKELGVKIHILTTNVSSGARMIKNIIEDRDL